MITKKQFMILFCVFLFAAVAYQTQPVDAVPFEYEYNDQYIASGDWDYRWAELILGDVVSGYFATDEDTKGLDFFVVNRADYNLWSNGTSVSGYEVNLNMHTLGFEFTAPYADDWFFVFSNVVGTENVWVDIGIDINGDETPYYAPADYEYTGYGEVVQFGDYDYLALTLAEGTVIDGHFTTFFTSDGLDFFICDEENYDDWSVGFSASLFSSRTAMHQATIGSFTVPTSGVWYLVWDNTAQADAVTYSYGIEIDTTNAVVGLPGWALTVIGLVAALLLLGICCCICRSKKKEPGPPTQPTVDHYVAPPSTPSHTPTVREREIVSERVLVICPYCGAKNEQGVLSCHNCDAEL